MCYYLSMKTFIVNVYKNKKWITLSLSILYLVLFFFPSKMPNYVKGGTLPFIIWIPTFFFQLPSLNIPQRHIAEQTNVAIFIIYTALLIACFVLTIISVVRKFKNKQFKFIWSFICAVLVMFLQGFNCEIKDVNTMEVTVDFCFTFYIFLILLILDVVYLVLEKHYKVSELVDTSKS